ncbi:hypothetical protein [Formosa sp. PL04]|uniref:hypothetical protein n=1 Tax=Formosa sp. PL04 TaxID=3081755 RepID=UPI0029822FE3|nr:hypothetical protein [Formosa sp. PL04]MDW5287566.1 hypothetical protein [Formosa sp. PL04]
MEPQNWNKKVKQNTKTLAFWTLAWLLSMALATFGPKFIWEDNFTFTLIGVILNFLIGIGMIYANMKQLKGLDELQQKIQLEAMGIALGVGIVGGLSYSLLDTTNIISKDAQISFLVMGISITYLVATFIGNKKYK